MMASNAYDRHIIAVLADVGEKGISVRNLAKHVYNLSCTLFEKPEMSDVHNYVQRFLLRKSKTANPMVEKLNRRGFYRLNAAYTENNGQQKLDFGEDDNGSKPAAAQCDDLSLSLFD